MTQESASPPERKAPTWLSAKRLHGAALALGSMVLGTLVGMAVREVVSTTGLLGPSVGALIDAQKENFGQVNERLDTLEGLASDPETKRAIGELRELLGRQDQLRQQADEQLRYLDEHAASQKERALTESGLASGIDFWLKPGESVNVGSRDQSFGLIGSGRGLADVNASGRRQRLSTGDQVQIESAGRTCTVTFRQGVPRQDGRVGFDLYCR
jgi:hypothetical protein